jgi:hypothetical protein
MLMLMRQCLHLRRDGDRRAGCDVLRKARRGGLEPDQHPSSRLVGTAPGQRLTMPPITLSASFSAQCPTTTSQSYSPVTLTLALRELVLESERVVLALQAEVGAYSRVFVQYLPNTERRAAGAARTGDEHPVPEHDYLRRELARQARVGDHALPPGEGGGAA